MKRLTNRECSLVAGGRYRVLQTGTDQSTAPPGAWSGLLGGISPHDLSGAAAVANFQSDYAQAQVDVGDMLTFQSSGMCTITTQSGEEIAQGELDVFNGAIDQVFGVAELTEAGDWMDGASEILTGMTDESAGFVELTNACPPDQPAPPPYQLEPDSVGASSYVEAA